MSLPLAQRLRSRLGLIPALIGLAVVGCGGHPPPAHPGDLPRAGQTIELVQDSTRGEPAGERPSSAESSEPSRDTDLAVEDSAKERTVRIRGVRVVEVTAAPVCGPQVKERVTNWWTASCTWFPSDSKYGTTPNGQRQRRRPPQPLPPIDDPPRPRSR